jgi:GPI-anchor transamidase subunit GAA1
MLGGIIWILLLPLNEYSRRTYISENALLPGQVHTYFGGSEQNVFRAYRHEVAGVIVAPWTHDANGTRIQLDLKATPDERTAKLKQLFHNAGLKTATQKYKYVSSGQIHEGENVYAVLHAPRGDGTEAIVLTAAIRNIENGLNLNGVTLLIALSRYFKRWSLWSKDIIFLVTPDSKAGTQAWVDAYHSQHDPANVADLTLKSGALQGAVSIDYPFEHRFENFHVSYDGINGQLPNLDLFNTAVTISTGQMGIGATIQAQQTFTEQGKHHTYPARVETLARGMVSQAIGQATGPHSVFMPYHIDAITLTAIGDGFQDEMAFGRTVESICRSLNNLLEKLHQSFFFYLLMQSNRFVSIGTYLPSAMAVAAAYTVMATYLWVLSGYRIVHAHPQQAAKEANGRISTSRSPQVIIKDKSEKATAKSLGNQNSLLADLKMQFVPLERKLTLPIAVLTTSHLLSLVPLYCLSQLSNTYLAPVFALIAAASAIAPVLIARVLKRLPAENAALSAFSTPSEQQYNILRALSLLLLGLSLTVLATLNFSLSMFLGLLCAPLAFVDRVPGNSTLASLQYALLLIFSPPGVALLSLTSLDVIFGTSSQFQTWLIDLAFGWNVWGSWGIPVGVLCIWWPAWTTGAMLVAAS